MVTRDSMPACEKTWEALLQFHKKYIGIQLRDLLWDQLGAIVDPQMEDTIVSAIYPIVVERSD